MVVYLLMQSLGLGSEYFPPFQPQFSPGFFAPAFHRFHRNPFHLGDFLELHSLDDVIVYPIPLLIRQHPTNLTPHFLIFDRLLRALFGDFPTCRFPRCGYGKASLHYPHTALCFPEHGILGVFYR